MKQHRAKAVLCEDQVRTYLEFLHRRFVIATFDTAVNSYALI